MERFGVGATLNGSLAEQLGIERQWTLLAVFHKLGQIQDRLRNLRQVWNSQGLVQTFNQFVLVLLAQLRPARHERRVEQVPRHLRVALTQRPAGSFQGFDF